MRGLHSTIAVLALLACGGCLATPNFVHPGTEAKQQARAQVFEPYPENEPGPPIVGGRPREYLEPRAEVVRVQPRIGEPIVSPYPQGVMPPPIAQPAIVTPPPAIYVPPAYPGRQPAGP